MMHGDFMLRLSARLRDALHGYSAAGSDVAAVGVRSDEGRKQALVRARRKLAEQIGHLGPIIEQDEELAREPEKQRELSRLFAAMRYALALHQADWPAVAIDDDPIGYRESALGVKEKSAAFWDWCQNNLDFERDRIGA
jgi:hypothetical protein